MMPRIVRTLMCAALVLLTAVFMNIGRVGAIAGDEDDLKNPPPGSAEGTPPGPVAVEPTIYVSYWVPSAPNPRNGEPWQFDDPPSPNGNADFKNTMNQFIRDFGGNPLFNILTQYKGEDAQRDPVNAAHFGGSYTDTTNFPFGLGTAAVLHRKDIDDAANRARDAFKDPNNSSSIFLVLVPYGVYYCDSDDDESTCTRGTPYAGADSTSPAYHSWLGTRENMDQLYAFSLDFTSYDYPPDTATAKPVWPDVYKNGAPHPSLSVAADRTISAVSHELFEAITDPTGDSWRSAQTHSGGSGADKEIGDLCGHFDAPINPTTGANVSLNGHGYYLQTEWSNKAPFKANPSDADIHGCAPDYCPNFVNTVCQEPLNFSLNASPSIVHSGDNVRLDFLASDPADEPDGTDTSYEQSTSVSVLYPDGARALHPDDLPLGAIAVNDQASGSLHFIADADHSLTHAITNQLVCATLSYTDSLGLALPDSDTTKCIYVTVLNRPPTFDNVSNAQFAVYDHAASFGISASDPENDPLTFSASGLPLPFHLTNNAGNTATISADAGNPSGWANPGDYPVTVRVSDGHNAAVSTTIHIFISRQGSAVTYTGQRVVANAESMTLSATLKDDLGAVINSRPVQFTLGTGSSAQTCIGVTSSGVASCQVTANQPLVGDGRSVPVIASFAGDSIYTSSPATSQVAHLVYLTGRASGAAKGTTRLTDTGDVTTPYASSQNVSQSSASTTGVSVTGPSASVTTTLAPGVSTATAHVTTARVGTLLSPTVLITNANAHATSSCAAGSQGGATVGSIRVGLRTVSVTGAAPNTVVYVGSVKLILNEQLFEFNPATGYTAATVTAVHVIDGPTDALIATARSDIHNC